MITVKRFNFSEKDLAEQAFAIRRKVFVEEQGVDPALEYDHEEEAHHYLLIIGGKPIAAARWRETEKGIKIVESLDFDVIVHSAAWRDPERCR